MSTTAWIYLGMSLLRLGDAIAAEDAIDQANILDNENCLSWAISSLICLQQSSKRLTQAKFCLREAIRKGLNDAALLEELGDLFVMEN
jgi:Tfp pilus assembly protein PilF